LVFFILGKYVPLHSPLQHDWPKASEQIQAILTMKAPLMRLWKERAFEKKVHDVIPTESQFRSLQEFYGPIQVVTKSVYKLRETDQPTIQHALAIIYQLCNLEQLAEAKWAQYKYHNFLHHCYIYALTLHNGVMTHYIIELT
jgi:hypothetical protein